MAKSDLNIYGWFWLCFAFSFCSILFVWRSAFECICKWPGLNILFFYCVHTTKSLVLWERNKYGAQQQCIWYFRLLSVVVNKMIWWRGMDVGFEWYGMSFMNDEIWYRKKAVSLIATFNVFSVMGERKHSGICSEFKHRIYCGISVSIAAIARSKLHWFSLCFQPTKCGDSAMNKIAVWHFWCERFPFSKAF